VGTGRCMKNLPGRSLRIPVKPARVGAKKEAPDTTYIC